MKPTLKQFIHMHCLSDKKYLADGGVAYAGTIPDVRAVRLPAGFHEIRKIRGEETKMWFSKNDRALIECRHGDVLIILLPDQETFDECEQSADLPRQQTGDVHSSRYGDNVTVLH
ncbi:MAG: hypothetical protein ACYC9J_06960 [Sulfuricaulis sp.]